MLLQHNIVSHYKNRLKKTGCHEYSECMDILFPTDIKQAVVGAKQSLPKSYDSGTGRLFMQLCSAALRTTQTRFTNTVFQPQKPCYKEKQHQTR